MDSEKLKRIPFGIYIVFNMWVFFLLDKLIFFFNFSKLGIIPRHLEGLFGVVLAPFIHSDIKHLSINTLPMLILLLFLGFIFHQETWKVFTYLTLLSGGLLWILGRSGIHVGASGLIYGLIAFIITYGWNQRDLKAFLISIVILLLYSGVLFGIFSGIDLPNVSWDGHLLGCIAGIILGIFYEKKY